MSMLHTVNKSPFERNTLDSCLQHALPGSSILLFEDAVYAALKETSHNEKLKHKLDDFSIYVLGPDLMARGFTKEQIIDGITFIDYDQFVDLTVEHDNVQSWV